MVDSSQIPKSMLRLVERYIDDRLSDDELQQLIDYLEQNEQAQEFLLQYCELHTMLMLDSRAERAVNGAMRVINGVPSISAPAAKNQAKVLSGSSPEKTTTLRKWPTLFDLANVAIACGIMLALFSLSRHYFPKANDPLPIATSGDVGGVNCVSIEEGSARLTLDGVGTVVVEGPAEFEMLSPYLARLTRGHIKVQLFDHASDKFVVKTPTGIAMDLGKSFGVDVSELGETSVVVFEGKLDISVCNANFTDEFGSARNRVRTLVGGEGMSFGSRGDTERIMSIYTGEHPTFRHGGANGALGHTNLISDVRDNLRSDDTNYFYEIIPNGLREDAKAFVDRPFHEWNGMTTEGMPEYLIGADYVKSFNQDKNRQKFELSLTLSKRANLYLFFDDRIEPPDWLLADFEDTGDNIGLDLGPMFDLSGALASTPTRADGPGRSINNVFSVWRRKSTSAGVVKLGPNQGQGVYTGMYGIAAIALEDKS